jgi:uncharacterized protein
MLRKRKTGPGPAATGTFEDAATAYNRGDYATALQFFRSLADQGNAAAQFNLGFMYESGRGVLQDYVQAHKWYNLAAARMTVSEKRDRAVRNRDLLASKMTRAQIVETQRLSREWKPIVRHHIDTK